MALRPGGAKAKGADGERELAVLLTSWAYEVSVPLDLTRNLEQTRIGGHDLRGLEQYRLAVEVKRVEVLTVNVWWQQAVRQATRVDCDPVLAYRQNRQPWRFRVRAWVHPAPKPLDVDMTTDVFRLWFQARIKDVLSSE